MSANKKKSMKLPIILGLAVIIIGIGAVAFMPVEKEETPAEFIENIAETTADAIEPAQGEETAAQNQAPAAEQAEAAPQAADGEMIVKPGNPVVATVDGKDITRVDVYRFIQTMPANMQQMPATTVYPVALDQVINTRIVQNKAEGANIEETEEFKAEMAIAKQQIARNVYLQKQVDEKITDKKVKKAYDDFIKGQEDVQERRARHILLETEDKAKAVIERIKAGGDFAALAQELSTGPTAARGGDLGYFARTEMVPEFAEAAFSMNKDDVSETPVQTQFGWHVIKIEDIRVRPKPTMEQMEPAIRAELRREVLDELIQDWRKDAKIEQFDINGEPLKEGANATGLVMPEPQAAE